MDATPYEWIPGAIWHLHLAIDDASGRIVGAWFDTQETLNAYYQTVDTGHCLRHNNNYYKMLDKNGLQIHYRKGTKTMFIQAFDGNKYCCVNDTDIYALEHIPEHEAKSKNLDLDHNP